MKGTEDLEHEHEAVPVTLQILHNVAAAVAAQLRRRTF